MNAGRYKGRDTLVRKVSFYEKIGNYLLKNMLTTLNISDKLITNIWRGGVMSVIFKGKYNIKSIIIITVFSLTMLSCSLYLKWCWHWAI